MGIRIAIYKIARAIAEATEPAKPKLDSIIISSQVVKEEADSLGLKWMYPMLLDWGQTYHYTKAVDWAEVFNYIYFKFPMPKYMTARIDCDDFSILLKGLVSALFGLNYFAVVFGQTPRGYHAWNLVRMDTGLLQFEPQTGNFFEIGEQGYKPEWILL